MKEQLELEEQHHNYTLGYQLIIKKPHVAPYIILVIYWFYICLCFLNSDAGRLNNQLDYLRTRLDDLKRKNTHLNMMMDKIQEEQFEMKMKKRKRNRRREYSEPLRMKREERNRKYRESREKSSKENTKESKKENREKDASSSSSSLSSFSTSHFVPQFKKRSSDQKTREVFLYNDDDEDYIDVVTCPIKKDRKVSLTTDPCLSCILHC